MQHKGVLGSAFFFGSPFYVNSQEVQLKYLACLLMILTSGCQELGGGLAEPIKLPNGAEGWVVNCSYAGTTSCFKSASAKCKNGYLIHERTTTKNTESKIPLDELNQARGIQRSEGYPTQRDNEDKYMVISCKEPT